MGHLSDNLRHLCNFVRWGRNWRNAWEGADFEAELPIGCRSADPWHGVCTVAGGEAALIIRKGLFIMLGEWKPLWVEVLDFLEESNKIEGTEISEGEFEASMNILDGKLINCSDLRNYVNITEPGARLRDRYGLDVRVGNHTPIPGGERIKDEIELILGLVNENYQHPYRLHQRYEALHPFTDGNGRSGRLLWAWQMVRFDYWPGLSLGFLHAFYYQALEFGGER